MKYLKKFITTFLETNKKLVATNKIKAIKQPTGILFQKMSGDQTLCDTKEDIYVFDGEKDKPENWSEKCFIEQRAWREGYKAASQRFLSNLPPVRNTERSRKGKNAGKVENRTEVELNRAGVTPGREQTPPPSDSIQQSEEFSLTNMLRLPDESTRELPNTEKPAESDSLHLEGGPITNTDWDIAKKQLGEEKRLSDEIDHGRSGFRNARTGLPWSSSTPQKEHRGNDRYIKYYSSFYPRYFLLINERK